MDLLELFRMTAGSVLAHKLRSLLIAIGILIGITGVLVNVSMVEGVNVYFEQQMEALGTGFVTIEPGTRQDIAFGLTDQAFSRHLFDALRRLPYVSDATAARQAWGTIRYADEEESVLLRGVEPGYLAAKNREMLEGAALSPQDRFNAVVDESVILNSFHAPATLMSPFEITVDVDGEEVTRRFRIKGIVKDPSAGFFGMGTVYIPVSTLNEMMGAEGYTEITLLSAEREQVELVKNEAVDVLDRLLRVEPDRLMETPGKETFMGFTMQEQQRDEYLITTQTDLLDLSKEISGKIQMALVGIASISLLVGGIGIANVMLVTVVERTREIGVMKAVGAKDWHVLVMFLIEAGAIGLLGGVVGVGLSAALSYTLLPMILQVPGVLPLGWVFVALAIALGIGVLSGLYPAIAAARMDPVDALKHE